MAKNNKTNQPHQLLPDEAAEQMYFPLVPWECMNVQITLEKRWIVLLKVKHASIYPSEMKNYV